MNVVKIKIGSEADLAGFDKSEAALKRNTAAANEFVKALELGVGIDIGGRITQSVARLPELFQNAIRRGVEFNATIGDAEIGISNVIQRFKGLDQQASKAEAAKAIAKIKEIEPQAAGSLQDLVQGFVATYAASAAAGVSVQQNVELVGKFANALANANIPAEQLSQEMRSIVSGNINQDSALARTLNITNADVERAKQAGNLFDFLNKKIGSLGEAGDSSAVRMSSLSSALDKVLGILAQPVSDALAQAVVNLTNALNDPATVESLRNIGIEVANVARTGAGLIIWAVRNASALNTAAHAAGIFGAALAGLGIAKVVSALGIKVAALVASETATQAETAALTANTVAATANAAAHARVAEAEGAEMLSRANWVKQANAVRAGGTTYASYAANGIGGVTMRDGVSAGALSGYGVAGARAGLASGAAVPVTLVAMTAAASLAFGAAIGSWLNSKIGESQAVKQEARDQVKGGFDSRLVSDVLGADTNTRDKVSGRIERQMAYAKAQLQAAQEAGDKSLERNIQERIKTLEKLPGLLAQQVPFNDDEIHRQTAEAKAEADEESRRVQSGVESKRQQAWKEAGEEMQSAWEQLIDAGTGEAPNEQIAALQAHEQRLRETASRLPIKSTGVNVATATPAELGAAANAAVDPQTAKMLLDIAGQIAQTQKAITAETEKQRDEMTKAAMEEDDRHRKALEAESDARDEVEIQQAMLKHDDERVIKLEARRDLQKEINALIAAGVSEEDAESIALAKINVQTQQRMEELDRKKQKLNDDLADMEEKPSGSRTTRARQARAREKRDFERGLDQRLDDAGFAVGTPERGSKKREFEDAFADKQRRDLGRFGGHARVSSQDSIARLDTSFDSLRAPVGQVIPTSPANAPAQTGSSAPGVTSANTGNKAGSDLEGIGKNLEELAKKIADLAAKVQSGVDTIGTGIDTIGDAVQSLSDRMDTVESQLSSLGSA